MSANHDQTARPAPQEWIDALARSEADVAAGRLVSGVTADADDLAA